MGSQEQRERSQNTLLINMPDRQTRPHQGEEQQQSGLHQEAAPASGEGSVAGKSRRDEHSRQAGQLRQRLSDVQSSWLGGTPSVSGGRTDAQGALVRKAGARGCSLNL